MIGIDNHSQLSQHTLEESLGGIQLDTSMQSIAKKRARCLPPIEAKDGSSMTKMSPCGKARAKEGSNWSLHKKVSMQPSQQERWAALTIDQADACGEKVLSTAALVIGQVWTMEPESKFIINQNNSQSPTKVAKNGKKPANLNQSASNQSSLTPAPKNPHIEVYSLKIAAKNSTEDLRIIVNQNDKNSGIKYYNPGTPTPPLNLIPKIPNFTLSAPSRTSNPQTLPQEFQKITFFPSQKKNQEFQIQDQISAPQRPDLNFLDSKKISKQMTVKNFVGDLGKGQSGAKITKRPQKCDYEIFFMRIGDGNPRTYGAETLAATNDFRNDTSGVEVYSEYPSPSKDIVSTRGGISFAGVGMGRDNRSLSSRKKGGEDFEQRPDAPAGKFLPTAENIINTVDSNSDNNAPGLKSEYEETLILVGSKGNCAEVSVNDSDKKNSLRQKT